MPANELDPAMGNQSTRKFANEECLFKELTFEELAAMYSALYWDLSGASLRMPVTLSDEQKPLVYNSEKRADHIANLTVLAEQHGLPDIVVSISPKIYIYIHETSKLQKLCVTILIWFQQQPVKNCQLL